jgi:hypothetical protein
MAQFGQQRQADTGQDSQHSENEGYRCRGNLRRDWRPPPPRSSGCSSIRSSPFALAGRERLGKRSCLGGGAVGRGALGSEATEDWGSLPAGGGAGGGVTGASTFSDVCSVLLATGSGTGFSGRGAGEIASGRSAGFGVDSLGLADAETPPRPKFSLLGGMGPLISSPSTPQKAHFGSAVYHTEPHLGLVRK